ncbi:MAG: hypothetical protein V7L23_33370 [Nostoc sp.]|uniref:hypothetical protein n=1 Tax=Nostoc sp. TaxID=1180 RepID=UPI002FF25A62
MADPTPVQVPQTINDTGGQFPPTSVIATGATLTPVTTTCCHAAGGCPTRRLRPFSAP